MTARNLVTHRTIYVPRGTTVAHLIDQVYGYLNHTEASAFLRAIDEAIATTHADDARPAAHRAARAYLRGVGIVVAEAA